MYTKKQRADAWIARMAFILVTLCSILFVVKEANHDCTGAEYPICAKIAETGNTLKKPGNGDPSVSAFVITAVACFLTFFVGGFCAVPYTTPVIQKVRMNN